MKNKKKLLKITLILVLPILLVLGFYVYYYNVYLQNNINNIFSILEEQNNSNEEKENKELIKLGYNKDEISLITNLDDENIKRIENSEKKDYIKELLTDTYFIESNLDNYINYISENEGNSIRENVEIVNTNRHLDFYTNIQMADPEKGKLILTNKYYKLSEDFNPGELVNLSGYYGLGSLVEESYNAFMDMHEAASEVGLRLYATSTYRDYDHQKRLYTNYAANRGQKEADRFSARPGHSEHQTGLALDFIEPGKSLREFENTDEFIWLQSNAHKFGFILRYPDNKEHITGYIYEPWHYRYVGQEVAKYIYENEITFDEYYAFYLK